jgi:hypothetical protein
MNGSAPGGLQTSTSFATDVGAQYLLELFLSGNPDDGPAVKTLDVSVGGVPQTFTYDTAANGTTRTHMQWVRQTTVFTATSALTNLTFGSATTALCC